MFILAKDYSHTILNLMKQNNKKHPNLTSHFQIHFFCSSTVIRLSVLIIHLSIFVDKSRFECFTMNFNVMVAREGICFTKSGKSQN